MGGVMPVKRLANLCLILVVLAGCATQRAGQKEYAAPDDIIARSGTMKRGCP